MDTYSSPLAPFRSAPDLSGLIAPQAVQGDVRKVRRRSTPNLMTAGHPLGEPDSKRRRVSLSDGMQSLTLAEPTEPATRTTAERRALKTALYNLANNDLRVADFIVLANRLGYCAPLYSFPVDTLQPSDWLALKERARIQIILRDASFLAQLPAAAITCDICMAAYRCGIDPKGLKMVPERLKKPFFTKLLEQFPMAICDLPSKEQTFERLLAICCARSWMLSWLPKELRTTKLALQVCQRTGYGLEYIPQSQRSYALCLKACAADGRALEHVPEKFKKTGLCRAALSTHGLAYQWLPAELSKHPEWQLLACQQDGAVLEYIPKDQHDAVLWRAACRSNPIALTLIDAEDISYEMSLLACNDHHDNVPAHDLHEAHQHIPDRHLDETLHWMICLNTGNQQMCERFKPEAANFYERLLQENPHARLAWVPQECRDANHYLFACQRHADELQRVPEPDRSLKVCLAACERDVQALQWVPDRPRPQRLTRLPGTHRIRLARLTHKRRVGSNSLLKRYIIITMTICRPGSLRTPNVFCQRPIFSRCWRVLLCVATAIRWPC